MQGDGAVPKRTGTWLQAGEELIGHDVWQVMCQLSAKVLERCIREPET